MEYVKISPSEQRYGKKELLYSQMEILTIMKRYQKFKQLRKEELVLKAILKRKIGEINEDMKIIEKSLPHVKTETTEEDRIKLVSSAKKRRDLETEILEIQRQIERLS